MNHTQSIILKNVLRERHLQIYFRSYQLFRIISLKIYTNLEDGKTLTRYDTAKKSECHALIEVAHKVVVTMKKTQNIKIK